MFQENITIMIEDTLGTENINSNSETDTIVNNSNPEFFQNDSPSQSVNEEPSFSNNNECVIQIDSNELDMVSKTLVNDLSNSQPTHSLPPPPPPPPPNNPVIIIHSNKTHILPLQDNLAILPTKQAVIRIDPNITHSEYIIPNDDNNNNPVVKIIPDEPTNVSFAPPSQNIVAIPKLVFIVPYRDRKQQYEFFSNHMKQILEDVNDYKIAYIHQQDERSFNRGAMKNIGFLIIKELYPNDYKDITLVFNDIDTMPYTKNFLQYDTKHGIIKHFYGYKWTLGGIVSIKGSDFEKINGFPNFWAWGYEDNLLNARAKSNNIIIDRSQFYHIMDKNILQLKDGISRIVNRSEFDNYIENTKDGITTLSNVKYDKDVEISEFYNVSEFSTGTDEIITNNKMYNITSSVPPFMKKQCKKGRMQMVMT